MNQTIKLDTRKRDGKYGEARIATLRRGERNNAMLTVKVCANGQPYDLAGKTASLVATTAAGKLVGPCPMQVAEAGIARIMLPAALYSAVRAFSGYVEIREGETTVDTTDSFGGKVIECADLDAEQAAEFTPILGELQNAVAAEAKRVEAEKDRARAEAKRETGFAEAKQAVQTATEAANDAAAGARSAAGSASAAAESASTAGIKATNAAAKAESDVRAFVNAASTAVGDAIAAAREDVDAAVKRSDAATAKAEAAVETADAANTAATKAVGDARDAIAEVKATEAKLYPAAENILVGSETGAFAHVDDAFAGASLRKITVEGACRQDGTPSPDNPVPIQVIENPVVKVTGRNLWDKGVVVYDYYKDYLKYNVNAAVTLPEGTYTISSDGRLPNLQFFELGSHKQLTCAEATDMDGVNIRYSIVWNGYGIAPPNDNSRVLTITLTRAAEMTGCVVKSQGTWIQVEYGTNATAYAPHAGTSTPLTLPAEHPYLAKLPDGTADTIEVDKDGNVSLVARVGRDTNVRNVVQAVAGKYYELRTILHPFASADALTSESALCSAIQSKNSASGLGIYRTWTGIYVIDTSGRTKEEIQAEVDKNAPLTVVAPIPEKRYSLGKIEMPKAQDSIINAWTDAEVTPRTGIEYTRDVNIVVANLESAIASITQG